MKFQKSPFPCWSRACRKAACWNSVTYFLSHNQNLIAGLLKTISVCLCVFNAINVMFVGWLLPSFSYWTWKILALPATLSGGFIFPSPSSSSNHLRHTQSSINIKNSCQILARSPFVHPEQLWLGVDFTRPRKALCVIWDRGVSGWSSPVSWKAEPSRVYTCFSSAYHICSVILKPGEYMGQASTL